MTALSAMQSAAIRLIGTRPATFFASTNTFELELCDLANEVAQDIADYQDWQALTAFTTLTGNGVATDFALPDDYDRQTAQAELRQPIAPFQAYRNEPDAGRYAEAVARGYTITPGLWSIYGNRFRVTPVLANAATLTYPYISKNFARSNAGVAKAAFDADTDSFVLSERVLTLGLVWRWREQKKLDATGDQEAFASALEKEGARDKGSRSIARNARRSITGVYPAWPWELG